MAISPNQVEALALEIRRIYAEAEIAILEKIARRLSRGIDRPGWEERVLAEILQHAREIERIIGSLGREVPPLLAELIAQAYEAGIQSADSDLQLKTTVRTRVEGTNITLIQTGTIEGTFRTLNPMAVQSLAAATIGRIEDLHLQILRRADDIYRSVIAEVTGIALSGVDTRRQAAQRALNRFADQGVGIFIDRSGRVWDIASYTEMATRAAIIQSAIQGHIDRMVQQDRDLVIVSDHKEECERCRKWEGKILSISGRTPGYPTIAEARAGGLWHPGCGHTINAYIPDVTEIPKGTEDPRGYEERQKQRYIERQIRRWKRREAAAITEEERRYAKAKVREWQARMREFIEETGRRRKYERESITQAR